MFWGYLHHSCCVSDRQGVITNSENFSPMPTGFWKKALNSPVRDNLPGVWYDSGCSSNCISKKGNAYERE
ncbi:hypothetical protein BACCAP_01177 [Pseudoflavonifractor capillosus ATCC 29799]|uniref:Uncharacterized protein n=1 Tax=Pseudoflavonifractor capillosus ATCC 29799 TaxID=411467 RepID=A6NSJ7_9FIRM|nr:hypothetical protein BACCAP_01177 [Pseudoflavonifractor capillosus ATCC 29799]